MRWCSWVSPRYCGAPASAAPVTVSTGDARPVAAEAITTLPAPLVRTIAGWLGEAL